MRTALLLLALLATLSGCLSEDQADDLDDDGCDAACERDLGTDPTDADSDDDGVEDGAEQAAAQAAVPAPLVFEGELKGVGYQGLLPVVPPVDPVPACTAQQCAEHVVTVPAGTWVVTFTLVGTGGPASSNDPVGVASTDYDLFVDGVGESTNPAGTSDVVTARLGAGDYSAQVLGWQDVDGSYTLTVTFAA